MDMKLLNEEIDNYLNKYKRFMVKDVYITSRMYDIFVNKYKYLYEECNKREVLFKNNIKYNNILKIKRDKNKLLKKHNRSYIDNKIVKYKNYFDGISFDNGLLNKRQREAIICEEDNLLVISSSRSDNSAIINGKIKYLIDIKGVDPKSIAVVYCRENARLEDEKDNSFFDLGVNVYTFSCLCLNIINDYNKNKCFNLIDDRLQYDIISNYIRNILFNNKEDFKLFFKSFWDKTLLNEEYSLFDNYDDYHNYMYKRKYITSCKKMDDYIKEEVIKRRNSLRTLNGEDCKSVEEVDIANFLYLNGINYTYEGKFNDLLECGYDFYIEQDDNYNYLKHFDNGNILKRKDKLTKSELESYLCNIKLKCDYHKKRKVEDLFILTYSSNGNGKKYLFMLKDALEKRGYTLFRRSNEEIYERLKETSCDDYIVDLIKKVIIPFINYLKKNGCTSLELLDKFKDNDEVKKQLLVLIDIYNYYSSYLKENDLLDFEDMVKYAYDIMSSSGKDNFCSRYEYLIFDGGYDFSCEQMRCFIKKVLDLVKVQVITFDIDYFNICDSIGVDLNGYIEDNKQIPVNNVYMSIQELVDIIVNFINRYNNQIKKKIIGLKRISSIIDIYTYDDKLFYNTLYNKYMLFNHVGDEFRSDNGCGNILLLEGFNSVGVCFKKNSNDIVWKKYGNFNIDCLSGYNSKIEYDNCILICDKYAFYPQLGSENIIEVLNDNFACSINYSIERILFYLALTKVKGKIYLLVSKSSMDMITKEIGNYKKC